MTITLLFIGDELLDGRILNKNQTIISKLLWEAGYIVKKTVSIGDPLDELVATMSECNTQSDVVICTGGLGPTEDDRTVEAFAKMAEVNLTRSLDVETKLRSFYQKRNTVMPESNLKQADIPKGSRILPNRTGTAVGIQCYVTVDSTNTWWFLLPGVTCEMSSMVSDYIILFLDQTFPKWKQPRVVTTFKCVGVGESAISDRLMAVYPLPKGIDIRYQVPFPEVHIQCCCESTEMTAQYEKVKTYISDQVQDCCYTTTESSFEEVVVNQLKKQKKTISVAESCTGGRISQMVTLVPGCSAVLLQGIVAYSNASKMQLLGVNLEDIDQHGAVSAVVAEAMAEGIRKQSGSDIGVSVTGVSGPEGGSLEKPVGTVFISISMAEKTISKLFTFSGQRDQIQIRATYEVLSQLLKYSTYG
jgi:nicotinamide-nucleotide amidase